MNVHETPDRPGATPESQAGDTPLVPAERRLAALTAALDEGVLFAGSDGTVQWANAAADALFGASARALQSIEIGRILPGWRPSAEAGAEMDARRLDGSVFPAVVRSHAVDDTPDWVLVIRDATVGRRAAESDALLHHAARVVSDAPDLTSRLAAFADILGGVAPFDTMSFAVAEGDGRFRIVAIWDAAGWRYPENRDAYDLRSARLEATYAAGDPALGVDTAEPDADVAERHLLERGVRSYISVPVVAGGRVRALLNLLSARPAAFSAEQLPTVRALVRQVAGSLNMLVVLERERAASEKLRELDQLRSDFVQIIAHDLRSPMAVIQAAAELLRARWDNLTDDDRALYLDMITRTSGNVAVLADDILTVTTIDSGSIRFAVRPFDLVALVRQAALESSTVTGRRIELREPGGLPHALGDQRRHWLVITNLLSNATKYSPPTAPVVVEVSADQDLLRVSVRDSGPGIPPEHVPNLFEKFARIPRPPGASEQSTTGLGLFICRALVEGQGGSIGVQTTPGAGSTFTYTVPLAASR